MVVVFISVMRYLLFISLHVAAIVIADDIFSTDLFSTDAPLDAPSSLWDDFDGFDTIGDLGLSDSSLPIASLDSAEQDVSSCLGESSDLLSWSRVRRRDGEQCSPSNQPIPFKGALPGWMNDLGDKLKDVFGIGEEEEEEFDQDYIPNLIDNFRCLPTHPFSLCCVDRGSFTTEIFMGQEESLYYVNCRKSMLFYRT